MAFEVPQGGVNFAFVVGFDATVQFAQGLHCGQSGLAHGQHGQGQGGPALDQAVHRRGQGNAAREQNARDVRIRAGQAGRQTGQQDIGPVAGGDDQAAVLQVVEKVAHLHGRHHFVVHQSAQVVVAVDHGGLQPAGHVADTGLAQGGQGGQDEDQGRGVLVGVRGVFPGRRRGETGLQGVRVGLVHGGHIDHDRHHLHAFVGHEVQAGLDGGLRFAGVAVHAAGHQQHGRAQVGGDVGVEVVLEGRVLSHEVRAFAQDEVVARLQRFVSAQNFVHEHGGLPFVDQFPGLFQRAGEGVGVGRVQVKARAQKFDVVVRPGRIGAGDDGPEYGRAAYPTQYKLHEPESDGRFARAGLGGGDIQSMGHSASLAGAPGMG